MRDVLPGRRVVRVAARLPAARVVAVARRGVPGGRRAAGRLPQRDRVPPGRYPRCAHRCGFVTTGPWCLAGDLEGSAVVPGSLTSSRRAWVLPVLVIEVWTRWAPLDASVGTRPR